MRQHSTITLFHNSDKSIESYHNIKMSVVVVNPINASICASSSICPCSVLEAGMTQDYSLSFCWPLGFDFISLPSHSTSPLFPHSLHPFITIHLAVPVLHYLLSLNLLLLSAPAPRASHCWLRQLFDKSFRSPLEQRRTVRQQWSPVYYKPL